MIPKIEVSASYRHISLKILEKFPEVIVEETWEYLWSNASAHLAGKDEGVKL